MLQNWTSTNFYQLFQLYQHTSLVVKATEVAWNSTLSECPLAHSNKLRI